MRKIKYYFDAFYHTHWHGRPKLQVGKYTYGRPKIIRYAGDKTTVSIGKYCSIAKNVTIFAGGNHRTDWISTYPFRIMFGLPGQYKDGHPSSKGNVEIGNDVWLGNGCTILSGVQIGDGAVVATQSVVVKNVPSYAIVGGNPAKVITYRFNPSQIQALLDIRWWDWPQEKVISATDLLCSSEIDEFISRYSS